MPETKRAVVLVSGGLDSATTLAIAKDEGYACHALAVDYGQRHRVELEAARTVTESSGVSLKVIAIDLRAIGGSALTADIEVPESPQVGIPITYVPARNTVLLSLALGYAEVLGAEHIFIGVNAVDYSGYPDCRPEYIAAYEDMAELATRAGVEGHPVKIHAPLINLTKSDIIRKGTDLGVDFAHTVSCYQADEEGKACGRCESCRIRAEGFQAADIPDPTPYQKP